eukprot:TRINITY_DN22734_c0_g4_i2.p1 TRINITY_DN22734_c0_g4~~TRINITY_DN22734_c0_g4_i2.p1  ORF type:complete len:489 (-),score=122.60 TRINITY_DN22734_c0_g4_i2:282-1748(-)
MVELRLEQVEDGSMPKDCFLSVRMGDIQKISRLGASRIYRFPQATGRRQSKIEVFQRIGVLNMDIDSAASTSQEVSINCQDTGFGKLSMKVGINTGGKNEEPHPESPGKKAPAKVKAAKEYLGKHNLEGRLSEAMQAVLRERPEDPASYMAALLMGGPSSPSKPLAPPRAAAEPLPETKETNMKSVPVMAAPPQAPSGSVAPKPAELIPFQAYVKEHIKTCPLEFFEKLHQKFPQPVRPSPSTSAPSKDLAAPIAQSSSSAMAPVSYFKPSVGTWLGHPRSLNTKVPAVTATSSPTTRSVVASISSSSTAAPDLSSWQYQPSVGTWLMRFSGLRRSEGNAKESVNDLRLAAAQGLMEALQNGSLADVIKQSKGSDLPRKPSKEEHQQKVEAVRSLAAASFMQAVNNGSLEEAISEAKTKYSNAPSKAQSDDEGLDDLKERAAVALKQAALDGSLSNAIKQTKGANGDTSSVSFVRKPSVGTWLSHLHS